MKFLTTLTILTLAFATTYAQVTIDESSFTRAATSNDTVSSSTQSGVALPTEGSAQTWDYSTLIEQSSGVKYYYDASTDTNYSNDLSYYNNVLTFQGLQIPGSVSESTDSAGWYEVGRTVDGSGYSIDPITSGSGDSIFFPKTNYPYYGRIDFVNFPATYQSQWTQTRGERIDFELTVGAASMTHTPGYRLRSRTDVRTVVGYGTLVMPTQDGSASAPMDVLLLKVTRTFLDSFYVNNSPAPAGLLTTFGLTQASTFADSFYVFYRPGFANALIGINYSGTTVTSVSWHTGGAEKTTGIFNDATPSVANCYPNPVGAEQLINISFDAPVSTNTNIELVDLLGKSIKMEDINFRNGTSVQFKLPENIAAGVYTILVMDNDTKMLSSARLLVE